MIRVTVAIIVKNEEVLIARRKLGHLAGKWEFPGGKIEPGEQPEQCLKRELKEELGIDAAIRDFFGESVYQYDNGTIQLLAYYTVWSHGNLKPTVHDKVIWSPVNQLSQYSFAPADMPFVRKLQEQGDGVNS